jgi:hypothetical protein
MPSKKRSQSPHSGRAAGPQPVQTLMAFMLKADPDTRVTRIDLLEASSLKNTRQNRRLVSIRMGHVRRRLRDSEQMLIRDGEGYWRARPVVDSFEVERWISGRDIRIDRQASLRKIEYNIAVKCNLLSKEAIERLKAPPPADR